MKSLTLNVIGRHVSETEKRIDFAQGGSITIHSTHNPDYLRGAGLDYVILDEAAFMEASVWAEVVRPMLLDRQGGALFLSTPRGKNWFYHIYQQGLNPLEPEWQSFHYTSLDNPTIARSEFESIQRSTLERIWREEYLAEFIEDAGQVFRGIREALNLTVPSSPTAEGRYIMGVDWGREHDYTCLVVIEAESGQMVALDRFNQVNWSLQRQRLENLAKFWRVQVIWAEANNIGAPNIEALQAEGLPMRPFMTTQRSKAQIIESLSLAIERREIRLLNDEILIHELSAYEVERLVSGGYRYSAPSGIHDDTVIATALAWYGVQFGGLRVDFA